MKKVSSPLVLRPLFFLGMLELVLQSAQRFDDLIEPRFEAEESGSGHHAQEKNENEQQQKDQPQGADDGHEPGRHVL